MMPPLQDPPDNGWLAQRIKDQPRLIGCALINPLMGGDAIVDLERSVNEFGFRGVKLMPAFYHYPIESEIVDPVMNKAAELDLPVTIHSGNKLLSARSDRPARRPAPRGECDNGPHGLSRLRWTGDRGG